MACIYQRLIIHGSKRALLAESKGRERTLSILKEQTQIDFVFWPLSRQVNSVKVNDPSDIEPTH